MKKSQDTENIQEHYRKFREAIDQVIEARETEARESEKRFKESLRYFLADGSSMNKVTDTEFYLEGVE